MTKSNLAKLYDQVSESKIQFDLLRCFNDVKKKCPELDDIEIEKRVGIIFDCYSNDEKKQQEYLEKLTDFICNNYDNCNILPRSKILSCFYGNLSFDEIQLTIYDMELTN